MAEELFGEFTCDETDHDCEMLDHDPLPATAVGECCSVQRGARWGEG